MADPDVPHARGGDQEAHPPAPGIPADAPDFEPSVLTVAGAIAIGLWLLSHLLTYLRIRLV